MLFLLLLTAYLWECVDYNVLFTNKVPGHSQGEKVHMSDVFKAPGQCVAHLSFKVSAYYYSGAAG